MSNGFETLKKVVQGKKYVKPNDDQLGVKSKAYLTAVAKNPSINPRFSKTVASMPQAQLVRLKTPTQYQAPLSARIINSTPGRVATGALYGATQTPVAKLVNATTGIDRLIQKKVPTSIQNNAASVITNMAGTMPYYLGAYKAVAALPKVGGLVKGIETVAKAGGVKGLAAKAIGAYAVGDPLVGAARGAGQAITDRTSIAKGIGRGVVDEITYPIQAAANIPSFAKTALDSKLSKEERGQAGVGLGLSALAFLPFIPAITKGKMLKVVPDNMKPYLPILKEIDDSAKKSLGEASYKKLSVIAESDPKAYVRALFDAPNALNTVIGKVEAGKLEVEPVRKLLNEADGFYERLEGFGVGAQGNRFEQYLKRLDAVEARVEPEKVPLFGKKGSIPSVGESLPTLRVGSNLNGPQTAGAAQIEYIAKKFGVTSSFVGKLAKTQDFPTIERALAIARESPNVRSTEAYAEDQIQNNFYGAGVRTDVSTKPPVDSSISTKPDVGAPIDTQPTVKLSQDYQSERSRLKKLKTDGKTFKNKAEYETSVSWSTNKISQEYDNLVQSLKVLDAREGVEGKAHLRDVIENGATPRNKYYEAAAKRLKELYTDLADLQGLKDEGKIWNDGNYLPRNSKEQVFGDVLNEALGITKSTYELPQLEHRKLSSDYLGDAPMAETVKFSIGTAVANIHKNSSVGLTPAQKVVDNIATAIKAGENKVHDVLGEYRGNKKPTKTINWEVKELLNRTIRGANTLFERIGRNGGEDVHNAYKRVQAGEANYAQKLVSFYEATEQGETQMRQWFKNELGVGDLSVLDRTGVEAAALAKRGLDWTYRKQPLDQLAKTASEYSYQPRTEQAVNRALATMFGEKIVSKGIADNAVAFMMRLTSMAHLWGKASTAIVQGTEIYRSLFTENPKWTAKAVATLLNPAEFKRVSRDYQIKDIRSNYEGDSLFATGRSKVESVGWFPIQKMEELKNTYIAAVAEAKYRAEGLTDTKLTEEVINTVNGLGLAANKFTRPQLLDAGPIARGATQYLQFGIKNATLKLDAFSDKKYGRLAGLMAADAAQVATMAALTGLPLKFLLGGLIPIGTPVLVDVATDTYTAITSLMEASQDGTSGEKAWAKQNAIKTGITNFIPGGSQGYRTVTALQDMDRGYTQTPTGRVKWETDKDIAQAIQAITFGSYSTKASREYYKNEQSALGENQSALYKKLPENQRTKYIDRVRLESAITKLQKAIKEGRISREEGLKKIREIMPTYGVAGAGTKTPTLDSSKRVFKGKKARVPKPSKPKTPKIKVVNMPGGSKSGSRPLFRISKGKKASDVLKKG